MNPYEQKRAEQIDRMRARAERLSAESDAKIAGARAIGAHIPMGQPILTGHHSERRHRRDLDRIDAGFRKGFALADEAKALARRAERAKSSTAVSSDDPDAIAKLREKVAELGREGDAIKAANKLLRASAHPPTGAVILQVAQLVGWTPERTASTLGILHSMGQRLLRTTGASAERRRIEGRIAELEARASAPAAPPELVGEARIEESDNRVRVVFPGKPSEAVRSKLKSAGFRWSPTAGAWQRMASVQAWHAARAIAGELVAEAGPAAPAPSSAPCYACGCTDAPTA